jgi:UDP-GlcNAc:undecaprenyl-phosphate GlcNAc-1-phosphate transferase
MRFAPVSSTAARFTQEGGGTAVREYLLAMVVAIAVTLLLGGPVRRLAVRFGAVGVVRDRDVHVIPTPRVGGIAMFGGLVVAFTVAGHFPMLHDKAYASSNTIRALLWGAFLVVLLGVIDDKMDLGALVKLAGQIFAASVMVVNGVQLTWLPIPGFGPLALDPTLGVVLSVLIVLALMNAVNFVDGLDGLAAGIVCIAATATFAYCYRLAISYKVTYAAIPALISIVTVGICIGFLCHNWDPARVFMGDTGSMLLGLLLAASAISITGQVDPAAFSWNINGGSGLSQTLATRKLVPAFLPLLLPISVSVLPLADMLMAVVRRTKAGRSPLAADKEHLHHRLLQIGHSKRRAVLIMYFWSALVASLTVLVAASKQRQPIVYLAIAMTLVGLLMLLGPRLNDHRERFLRAAPPPTPDRWRSDATPARHRAGGEVPVGAVVPPATPAAAPVAPAMPVVDPVPAAPVLESASASASAPALDPAPTAGAVSTAAAPMPSADSAGPVDLAAAADPTAPTQPTTPGGMRQRQRTLSG